MSSRGEAVPELAQMLREIADHIVAGTATKRQAVTLRRVARQLAGDDPVYSLRLHYARRGQPTKGGAGVDQRFELAQMVKAHRERHGGSLEEAFRELNGTFNLGPESIRKAWQEMSRLLDLPENDRRMILMLKGLETRGLAKVSRRSR